MRLEGPESGNVEDRRGRGGGFGGGMRGGGMRGGGLRIGGIGGIAIILIGLFLGVDLSGLVGGDPGVAPQQPQVQPRQQQVDGQSDAERRFVALVLGETEQVWKAQFAAAGRQYEEPTLVLFSGVTRSGCGTAQAQVGPFYCPNDKRVYIDLDFMKQLMGQLGAKGDFAAAYIIAHEVGHHVQNLLGILPRFEQMRRQVSEVEANALGVRIELQADCLAGVWAHNAQRARNIMEAGDLEEGLNAAAAVGDDRIQRQQQGYVRPETFTHGTSQQRVSWFKRGFESGNVQACDTFAQGRP